MEHTSNTKLNLIDFLKEKYTPFGLVVVYLILTSFFMLFLEPYIYVVPRRLTASLVISFILIALYGSISMYAVQRNGSSFGMLLRLLFFMILAYIFFTSALIHWKYGLVVLIVILFAMMILKEKSKSKVIQDYSTRDLIFNNREPKNIVSRTLEKLRHEVILGPGYNDRIIENRITDIKRAVELGNMEITKGTQESSYAEMQVNLNLIHSRLANISNEACLYNLQAINQIRTLEQNIQKLVQETYLSRYMNEVQKRQLLIELIQYEIHLAKLNRVWQNIHQTNRGYETGFE